MKKLQVDTLAIQQEMDSRRSRNPKASRAKALEELSGVISADLTIGQIHAYIEVLASTNEVVASHLSDITLEEVLTHAGKGSSKPAEPGKRRRATKAQIEAGYQALLSFLKGNKEKLQKAEIFRRILAQDPVMDVETLDSAWNKVRPKLKDEGQLRNKVYWYASRNLKIRPIGVARNTAKS